MKTTALVIGNNTYYSRTELNLNNSINDANSIENSFKSLNFHVIKQIDIDRGNLSNEISKFAENAEKYEVAIIYFSGHGFQFENDYYICCTDTDFTGDELSTQNTSIGLSFILRELEKCRVGTKIIILDSCRTPPITGLTRGINTDSKPLSINPPNGTFIEYSTSSNCTAHDGEKTNGTFTEIFLKYLLEKDLSISDLFMKVRNDLSKQSENLQINWDYNGLLNQYFFNPSFSPSDFSYSEKAYKDEEYDYSSISDIMDIIRLLKSLNWYNQNDAIKKLYTLTFSNLSSDDVFILGRNLYQTSCSKSRDTANYFYNLKTNLLRIPDDYRFHLVNGMLYEMYFNKQGKIRATLLKWENMSTLINLLSDKDFYNNAQFIHSKIIENSDVVLYDFFKSGKIKIKLEFIQLRNTYCIDKIIIDKQNCFYDSLGIKEFEYDKDEYLWFMTYTKDEINNIFCKHLGCTQNNFQIQYDGIPKDTNIIGLPYVFQLRRKPIKIQ